MVSGSGCCLATIAAIKVAPPCPALLLSVVAVTLKKLLVAKKKKETTDELAACRALQHLVELYCTLIEKCLVPSSALELHLLIRLLTVSEGPTVVQEEHVIRRST
jgi:hypothetical protein